MEIEDDTTIENITQDEDDAGAAYDDDIENIKDSCRMKNSCILGRKSTRYCCIW